MGYYKVYTLFFLIDLVIQTLKFMLFFYSEAEKERILRGVERSVEAEAARAKEFGLMVPLGSTSPSEEQSLATSSPQVTKQEEDKPQPEMFQGNLKPYQRKGMTWLVNLYDQVSFYFFNYLFTLKIKFVIFYNSRF